MAYLGKTPSQAVRSRYYFTATGGETSLSGTDDNSNTLTFTDGNYVDVALNGVTLVAGTDYNTTTANTIGGLTALVASDVVEVIVYDTFSVFGGNMAANLNFKDNVKANFGTGNDLQIYHDGSASNIRENGTGNLQIWGDDIHFYNSAGSENIATFITNGAVKLFYDNAQKLATTATGVDVTGTVTADGLTVANSVASADLVYFNNINPTASDVLRLNTAGNGSGTRILDVQSASTTHFMVRGDGNVGINTAAPPEKLSIEAPLSTLAGLGLTYSGATKAVFSVLPSTGEVRIGGTAANYFPTFYSSGSERMRIDTSGNVLVGKTAGSNTTKGSTLTQTGEITSTITTAGGASQNIFLNRQDAYGTCILMRYANASVGHIGLFTGNLVYLGAGNTGLKFGADIISPSRADNGNDRDNVIDLGKSASRFDNIYATNATIQTSDANEKQQIAALTDVEMTAAKAISQLFKTYKWNSAVETKGDAARTHTGVIAQDVQAAMTAAGLDAGDYAFFISSTWWETQTEVPAVEAVDAVYEDVVIPAVLDDDGNEIEAERTEQRMVTEAVEAVAAYTRIGTYNTAEEAPEGATERTRMGIRYPELLAFIGAATEQRLSNIETRLAALENV